MHTEYNKILECNHGEKSLKVPFIISFDLECLLKKEQSCQNNPEKSYTEKKSQTWAFWLGNVYKMFIWWKRK